MTRTKIAEQTPLLSKNGHTSYMSTNGINNQNPLNRSDSSSSSESIISKESDSLNNLLLDTNSVRVESTISIGNDWEDSVGRYGGITKKRKDENGNWEYETKIFHNLSAFEIDIYEKLTNINNQLYSMKTISSSSGKIIFELLNLKNIKQLEQKFKIYANRELYNNDLRSLDLKTFIKIEQRKSTNWGFVISALGIIPLVVFARTAQRVLSVNITDGKEHTYEDWTNSILNITDEKTQYNFIMASIDIVFSLITSEVFKWSRKNIIVCCQNQSNTTSSENNSYTLTLAIHLWSALSNHVVVTAASMYTLDSFNWLSYGLKLVDWRNILSTMSRLYVMTVINNKFKWSLNTLNNELELSNKFKCCTSTFNQVINFINEANYLTKFITAWTSFGLITFSSNAIKTLSSLIAEYGKNLGLEKFPNKFFTWGMLGTSVAMTLTDGINLLLDKYKKPLWKTIINTENALSFPDNSCDNETKLLEQHVDIEAQSNNFNGLLEKYNLNEEKFYDSLDSQPWINVNEINTSEPINTEPINTGINYSHTSINM